MKSIKVKFRPSSIPGKRGSIYFQIKGSHYNKQHRTSYHIFEKEWDEENSALSFENSDNKEELLTIKNAIDWDLRRLEYVFYLFEQKGIDARDTDAIEFYENRKKDLSLFEFMTQIIAQLKVEGRIRTSETYTTTLYSIGRFLNHKDIVWQDLTKDLVEKYEESLFERGVTRNSSSFYMRILRAVYNRAVANGVAIKENPFTTVYTGIDKTIRHALSVDEIKHMVNLDYSNNPLCEFARDMFLFSFYTRGMGFNDMAHLKKTDIINGLLVYQKSNNKQKMSIKWEPCMQEILDKHHTEPENPYLLPIFTKPRIAERNQYKNIIYRINKSLKTVGDDLGLKYPLSLGMARHSWANIANEKEIDISIINQSLGNDSEQITKLYLASLNNDLINDANKSILDDVQS